MTVFGMCTGLAGAEYGTSPIFNLSAAAGARWLERDHSAALVDR